MADEHGIVRYKASDGSDVKLTPGMVAKYVITGGQQADERDVYAFMAKCQARHLNPLAGDAYMTTYRNRDGSVTSTVIVSKDYFVRTATQQPGFDGLKAGIIVDRGGGDLVYREGCLKLKGEELVGGWAEVHDKGRSYPSRAEVSLDEYNQHRSLWNSKPATMIRKVALVQALREAYPGAYGGLYDRDEVSEPERGATVEVPAEVVEGTADAPVGSPAWAAKVVDRNDSRSVAETEPQAAAQAAEPDVYAEDVEW